MITTQNKKRINILTFAVICLFAAQFMTKYKANKLKKRVDALENKVVTTHYAALKDFSAIDFTLTQSIIQIESSGYSEAYNTHSGAVGLMQLRPVIYNKLCGLTKKQAFEPANNIACGTLFVRHLLRKYGGNLEKALLFYNNGYIVTNEQYAEKVLAYLEKEFDKTELTMVR